MMNKPNTRLTKTIGQVSQIGGKKGSMSTAIVTARFTSDKIGETLSLQVGDIQISVPFEPLAKMIKATRSMTK